MTTGVVRHACRHRVTARGVFVWGILLRLDWEPLREHVLAGGPASHACRRGSGSTRGFNFFVLGGSFTRSGVDGTRGLGVGGLIRCAGRPREWSCGAVPPQERWHEGGWFLFFLWRLLRCRRGILSHAQERRHPALRRGRRGALILGIVSHALEWTNTERTCIDCHKGIAHQLPDMTGVPDWQTELDAPERPES